MKKPTTKSIFAVLAALFLSASAVDADWWDYAWEYRMPMATNSPEDLLDYQIALNVSYVPSMQSDFDDLRFTDPDGIELSYWIEQKQDSSWAYLWVNVPSIAEGNSTAAYMYYSNPDARTTSSCADTFVFCDDFIGERLDWAAGWQSNDQELYSSSLSHMYCLNTSRLDDKIETLSLFEGYVFESRLRTPDAAADGLYMLLNPVSGVHSPAEGIGIASNEFVFDFSESAVFAGGSAVDDAYYVFSFRLPAAGDATALVYSGDRGEELVSYSASPDYRAVHMGFLLSASDTGYVDWALVRAYAAAEPSASFGEETWMNSAPDDPFPELLPAVSYASDNVSCFATYWDMEGDDGTLTFDLSVNGEFAARCPPRSVVDGSELSCSLLAELEGYVRGDVVNCTVTAVDNNSQQTVSWTSLTLQNSPPTEPTYLTPIAGFYSGAVALNCSGSTDPDDDDVYYDLQVNVTGSWEDVATEDVDGVFLWDAADYDMGGVGIRCRATDLSNASDYFDPEGAITLDNTPPQVRLNDSVSDHWAVFSRLWAYVGFYSNEALGACFIEWDGGNESANVSETRCVLNMTDSAGNHTFRAWASDSAGNFNASSEYWVYLGTTTSTTTTTTRANGGGGGGGGGGGTNQAKPKVSCFDGLQNQGEKGVDCGGPCALCPSCDDGIQNQGERGIDCGGPCAACTTATTATTLRAARTTTTTTSQAAATTTNARILAATTMADAQSSAVPLGLTEGTILLSALALVVISIRIHKGKL